MMKRKPQIDMTEVRDLSAIILQKPMGNWPDTSRPHKRSDEISRQVSIMAACGMGTDAMGMVVNLNNRTLVKHYGYEIEHGRTCIKAHMSAVIVNAGLSGNITAAKYYLSVHFPEWRVNNAATASLLDDQPENSEVVHFYLPENGRDQPEDRIDPLEIDGEAEVAA